MPEYLDAEIANEGVYAVAEWAPAVEEARIPTYKGIKSIARYFPQFTGRPYQHQTFPCWLYHPTLPAKEVRDIYTGEDPPRLIKKASELAAELGCVYRQTTLEERAQGFPNHRWVYSGEWRAQPYDVKFDPKNPGTGKNVIYGTEHKTDGQNSAMIAVAVAEALAKFGGGKAAAPGVDPDYEEFQAFKAWKAAAMAGPNALGPEETDRRETLEISAKALGIKVDGRWSNERLKAEIDKAS